MQKLFTSKDTQILLRLKHIRPLFRLRDSAGTTEHLHHVHWEHLQMFQQKELTDVKIAHQVTSGFFVNPVRRCQLLLILKSVGKEIERKYRPDVCQFNHNWSHYVNSKWEEAIDVILSKSLQHERVQ